MCKYCDFNEYGYADNLSVIEKKNNPSRYNGDEIEAYICKPTDILAEPSHWLIIDNYLDDRFGVFEINFCPMCGKDLREEK